MSSREWNIQPGHLSQWLRVFRSCLLTWSLKTSLGFFWKPLHLVLFISMEVRDCDFSFASVEAYLLSKAALYVQRHKVWSQCCSRSGRARGVTLGIQCHSAHPLQLFLLIGQIICPKRINHLMKTTQSVCWARNLWAHVSTDYSLCGPTPDMCLSATQTHSTFKTNRVAKTDVEKLTLWLGW